MSTLPIVCRAALVVAGLSVPISALAAQNQVINGDLEAHTFVGCAYNQTNASFSAGMTGATAFGALNEPDVMVGACGGYGPAGPVQPTSVGLACNASNLVDGFTIQLVPGLVSGQTYTLSFWGYSSVQTFSPQQGTLEFGLSNIAGTVGTQFYTSPLLNGLAFQQYTTTFTAASAATELSVQVTPNLYDCWLWIDGIDVSPSSGPSLTVNSPCPGSGTVDLAGMTPLNIAYFGWSVIPAPWTVPGGSCAGTIMGIFNPTLLFVMPIDPLGNASMPVNIPPIACGLVSVQSLDVFTCTPTNVVAL